MLAILRTYNLWYTKRDDMLHSTRVLELLPWAVVGHFSDVHLDALLDRLVRVVSADCLDVNPFLLRVATRKIRKMVEEVNGCFRLALAVDPRRSDLWPSGRWWGLEFGRVEVKTSGEELVELGYAGNDLVAVVKHDDVCLGCFYISGELKTRGIGWSRVELLRFWMLALWRVLSRQEAIVATKFSIARFMQA